jgi:ribosomal protein S17E
LEGRRLITRCFFCQTTVRTKTVKKSAKVIIERYYPKLTLDFETNKRICDEIAIIASKRLRNKVRAICRSVA